MLLFAYNVVGFTDIFLALKFACGQIQAFSMPELSFAKLRPAYTSYPLVFGQLAYAEDVCYVQVCLLKLAAAEKKLSWVGVGMIKSTSTKKQNFLGRAELHSGSASVIKEAFIRKEGLYQDLKGFTTYISLELGKNILLKISLEIRNFPRSREIFYFISSFLYLYPKQLFQLGKYFPHIIFGGSCMSMKNYSFVVNDLPR